MKDQRKIKQEVVGHVMEHNSSPERVLDSIMEEIISKRDQVVKEGGVSDELIEVGIRNFLTIDEIVEKIVIEVDNSTILQDMQKSKRKHRILHLTT